MRRTSKTSEEFMRKKSPFLVSLVETLPHMLPHERSSVKLTANLKCLKMNTAINTAPTEALRRQKNIINKITALIKALLLEGLPDYSDGSNVDI
ncbi:hypothetical protein EVAR_86357_1 [Eumeta japonica]|uniref:Uncharacterized protein n=1 Tax=Eumeta variegata TaxID=151549 RepID=A0A4C1YHC2_EUMVA|nr:hypothetical protein EVAR_86357_1 [Eumeta japonica]